MWRLTLLQHPPQAGAGAVGADAEGKLLLLWYGAVGAGPSETNVATGRLLISVDGACI